MSSIDKDRSGEVVYDGNSSASISTVSSESVSISAGAAGTLVSFQVAKFPIRNVLGGGIGSAGDTSFSFVSGVFTAEVAFGTEDADLANGQFWINYITGEGRGRKATTGTTASATYKIIAAAAGGGGGGGGEMDLTAINGTAPSTDTGESDAGTLRVEQASGSLTPTLSNVSSSATSAQLLDAESSRKGASFFNDSTSAVYLKLGATASATSFTVKMRAGEFYELPVYNGKVYQGTIDAIWDSANGAMRITELT